MIFASLGNVQTYVYSGNESLVNWSIRVTSKNGRDLSVELNVPMSEIRTSDKRYLLYWDCPYLSGIEHDYEITSSSVIIDKGILRYGVI